MQTTIPLQISNHRPKNYRNYYFRYNFKHSSIIGVYSHERIKPQNLFFDIFIHIKSQKKLIKKQSKSLIIKIIKELCKENHSQLLENISHLIAKKIIDKIKDTQEIIITIKKPRALDAAQCSYVKLVVKNTD
ncbi:MAG: dihydroneopterin aldolase [Myxococcales bacterium]|nr:dihydroneopterin aldolase [Myxococcales bacterium]USN51609.1 MAG: dihydroneopterin aldolase [Myxococcales bacterium]